MIGPALLRRKHAYVRLFRMQTDGPTGDVRTVLADLKRFARLPDAPIVRSVAGQVDPIASAVLAGRQEVVNRILAHVHIDERAYFNLREETDDDR
jgi:hypothetical protein